MAFRDKEEIALGVTLVLADDQSTCSSGSFARADLNCITISPTHGMRSVMTRRLPCIRRIDQLLRLVVDLGAGRTAVHVTGLLQAPSEHVLASSSLLKNPLATERA